MAQRHHTGYEQGYWREGQFLVARDRVILPPRCVKCNADQHVSRKVQTFYWLPKWTVILFFINVLAFMVAALMLQRRVVIAYYICREHERKKRMEATVSVLSAAAGFALLIVGACLFRSVTMAIVGAILFLGALWHVLVNLPALHVSRCADGLGWFSAADARYLDALEAEAATAQATETPARP